MHENNSNCNNEFWNGEGKKDGKREKTLQKSIDETECLTGEEINKLKEK